MFFFFFFSSRRRHTRLTCDWSSDVCSSDLAAAPPASRSGFGRSETRAALRRHFEVDAESVAVAALAQLRSEERRVGKECRSGGGPCHEKNKQKIRCVGW